MSGRSHPLYSQPRPWFKVTHIGCFFCKKLIEPTLVPDEDVVIDYDLENGHWVFYHKTCEEKHVKKLKAHTEKRLKKREAEIAQQQGHSNIPGVPKPQ